MDNVTTKTQEYNTGINILLIDDNEDDYLMTRSLLESIDGWKARVDWASNYGDGVKCVKENRHDVYLIDYRLGENNGISILKESGEETYHHPFIILTGEDDRTIDLEAMAAGAADYLIKDQINSEFLERSIRYALEKKYAEEHIRKSNEHLEREVSERSQSLEQTTQKLIQEMAEHLTAEKAREKSEQTLEKLTEAIPGVIYQLRLHADGTISFPTLSQGFEEICEMPVAKVKDDPSLFLDMIVHEDAEHFWTSLKAAAYSKTAWNWSGKIILCSGKEKYLEAAARAELLPNQETLWHGVFMDVTNQRVVENKLRQTQKLEAIGQLAAGIVHEINTPIQFIGNNICFLEKGFTQLISTLEACENAWTVGDKAKASSDDILLEIGKAFKNLPLDSLEEEILKALRDSTEGNNRVAEIVRAMRDYSHPGSNEKEPTDLNQAITNAITVSRNAWKYVAEIVTEFDSTLPSVPLLHGEFKQVLLNLIVNAAHAIEDTKRKDSPIDSKGRITIRTRNLPEYAEISIEDTGAGIPEAIRSKIFDLFFTTKEPGRGTGQGLALARSIIVDHHGGSIDVHSEVGKGSRFLIQIPKGTTSLETEHFNPLVSS